MFKSNGGFTLVELIVVIAILGLLAGIGIPAYSEYMATAKSKIDAYEASQDSRETEIDAIWDQYVDTTAPAAG